MAERWGFGRAEQCSPSQVAGGHVEEREMAEARGESETGREAGTRRTSPSIERGRGLSLLFRLKNRHGILRAALIAASLQQLPVQRHNCAKQC